MKRTGTNITRYTYETTTFQGWRLAIRRKGEQIVRYFSGRKYGSEEAAFKAARKMRNDIFDALEKSPENPREVFASFMHQPAAVKGGVA